MARRTRLDAELVRRGLARSREQAAELVSAGRVEVRGTPASKPAALVDPADPVRVTGATEGYVSRGAHKLAGALAASGVPVEGRRCLDAGASTGGFADPRVVVRERVNARHLSPREVPEPCGLATVDVSFISVRKVLPALRSVLAAGAEAVVLVKPQFEVGRERVGAGGVVRDPGLRAQAVLEVAQAAGELGWGTAGVVRSPLPGPSGNVEFFLWLRRDAVPPDPDRVAEVAAG